MTHFNTLSSLFFLGLTLFFFPQKAVDPYTTSPLDSTLVGATSGSFSVSDAGAATYSIPIIVSPGTSGMQPSISLSYSSSGVNGVMGLGWSMLGISTIQRSGKTLAQDDVVDGVSFDANDTYSLDGERLVLISGNFGANNSEYRTEQNVLLKVTAKGNTPGFASPEWFEVRTKAGLIMEYGRMIDSRIEAQGTNTVMFWCVSKITDTKGNYMTFTYEENTQLGEYYPKRIDYTGNTSAGLLPYNSLVFNYMNRIDNTPRYVNGTRMVSNKILTSIECLHGPNPVRKYSFEYKEGDYTQISLLKSIQECGTSPLECLPPTVFTYKNESALGYDAISGSPLPVGDFNGGSNRMLQGDWDGDGLTDFLRHDAGSGVNTFYRNNTGFNFTPTTNPINIGELDNGYIQVLDVNTDGYSDIWWIDPASGTNAFFINNKTAPFSFVKRTGIPASELTPIGGDLIDPMLSDWNGDGQVDIMTYYAPNGRNRFFLNKTNTNNGIPSFDQKNDLIPGSLLSTSGNNQSLIPGDWDNDGLTDLFWFNRDAGSPTASNRWIRNTGNGQLLTFSTIPVSLSSVDLRGGTGIQLGDWNGDGQTDLMWHNGGDGATRWWYNKGNFTFLSETVTTIPAADLKGSELQLNLVDFNGDGASDVITYNKADGKNHWFLNNGNLDFSRPLNPSAPAQAGFLNPLPGNVANATGLQFGEFSGKGGMDVLYLNVNASSNNNRWFESKVKPHYLLEKIVNGQGLNTSIVYKPLTDNTVYNRENSAIYPLFDFAASMLVVANYDVDNGIGGKTKVGMRYIGGKTNLRGRGFRGFTEIHQKDETTGITSSRFFERDHRYVAAPLMRSETRLAGGQLINEVNYKDTLISYYSGKAFAAHTFASETKEYELDGSLVSVIKTRMKYDDYGNVITSVVDYGDGHLDSNRNVYAGDNYNKWHIGRLTRSEMYRKAPGLTWSKRTAAFVYNSGDGLLIKEITEPDLPAEQQIVKEYMHDVYGNITQSKTTFHNGDQFETRILNTTFDNRGRFNLSVSNQLGHTKTTTYDPLLGHPVAETDANGLKATYAYDPIGRLTKVTYADGNWRSSNYEDCSAPGCPANSVFSIVSRSSVEPEERTYYDVLGRELMSRTVGFDSTVVLKKSEFNYRGLLSRVSAPHFINETPVWTSFRYDTLGRETEVIAPGNRVTKTQYLGLTISTQNPLNQFLIVRKNVPGRVFQVTDNANKTIKYEYDANGNLLRTIDPNGNTISITYDTYGHKLSSNDPDMGAYQYVHNPIGELRKQTNPKGQITTYKYDILGRIIQRKEPEGETNWTFDTKAKGIGKISSISAPAYTQEFLYDTLSRISRQTESFGGQLFDVQHYYDAKGRPSSLHYPGGFAVKYIYNNQNYLSEVRNSITGASYWKADQVNARDQLVQQTLGNGTISQNTFDPTTFWLKKIQSFSAGSVKIQDLSYTYNNLGVLTQRVNAVQAKTENFAYDNLNRLLTSTTLGGSTLTMTYDALGNITSKSDVGQYFYGENGAGPHQLTRVKTNNPNNCLPSLSTDFTFASYNMVKTMENDSARLEIDYNASRSRMIQRQYLDSTLVQTKYYVGSLFERVVTDTLTRNLYYIHAMGGVVAVHSENSNGISQTEYWHKDHLGSVQTITNQQGQVLETLEYDPWGKRIKTPGPSQQAPYRFDRGFTGHEHLDLFALVNMNGRVYDPTLGRFISPDPFIQNPLDLQNLNRYAYVSNCPLAFTDPSGFFKISFAGISFNKGKFSFSGDPKDWLKGFDINGKNPLNKLLDFVDKRAAKAFGQENWNTIKVTSAAVAVAIGTGGMGSGLGYAMLSGAASGFVGAYSGVSLAGGSASDAFKAGLKGAAIGSATAAATYGVGSLAGEARSAVDKGGGSGFAANTASYGVKIIGHGVVQGASSELNGGKFEHGFMSGAFSAAASSMTTPGSNNLVQNTVMSAVVGGTASELGGGKFSNGAISGAMVYLCNEAMHPDGIDGMGGGGDESNIEDSNFKTIGKGVLTVGGMAAKRLALCIVKGSCTSPYRFAAEVLLSPSKIAPAHIYGPEFKIPTLKTPIDCAKNGCIQRPRNHDWLY
jgi:RHS repeat-associated protein